MKTYRLDQVAEIYDGPHATPKKTNSGPIFLGISSLQCGRLNLGETDHLSEEDFRKWTRRVTPRAGDVVFSYETRLGEAAIIPDGLKCCLGRRMGLLRPKSDLVDSNYLLYHYLSPQFQELIRQRTVHGSTVDRIPLVDMPQWQISIPDILIQKQIASALATIDTKILLNSQINETLEAILKAIFKEWFIDFGPMKARAKGKKPFGMNDETADLFPDSFEDSELGPIPKGWKISALYDLANWQNGMAFKPAYFSDGGLPIIKIAELKSGIDGSTKKTDQIHEEKFKIKDGEILFSWSGSPDTSIDTFIWDKGDAWLNQHIFKVTAKETGKNFVYSLLKYLKPVFIETARNKQTTGLGHVTVADLKRLKSVVPTSEVIKAFDKIAGPILAKYFLNLQENLSLVKTRDLLLPKLISGEVSLEGAIYE